LGNEVEQNSTREVGGIVQTGGLQIGVIMGCLEKFLLDKELLGYGPSKGLVDNMDLSLSPSLGPVISSRDCELGKGVPVASIYPCDD
jgi:hypothetical protein